MTGRSRPFDQFALTARGGELRVELDWFAGDAADDSEHFTAQAFFAYQLRERGLSLGELAIAPRTLITFQRFLYAHALPCTGAVESVDWARFNRHPLAGGRWCGEEVAIVLAPVCAPAAIMYLELLAAGGVQSVIAVGAAGSLQAYAPLGAAVLPTSAIREEGTSYHYAPPSQPARPNTDAVAALRETCDQRGISPLEGEVWTTDAPFRELTSKVQRFAARGVVAVDMEASALFIVAERLRMQAASLFIVSDELFHPWRPGFFDRAYLRASAQMAEAALDALVRLPVPTRFPGQG